MIGSAKAMMGGAGGKLLRPQDVFEAVAYTGNAAANRPIGTAVDLTEGGLAWIKNRAQATTHHHLTDTARGPGKVLYTSQNVAEATVTAVTGFTSTGITISGTGVNNNAASYIAYLFRRAPKFFDIVTWDGDATLARPMPHSLQTVPGIVWARAINQSYGWTGLHLGAPGKRNELSTNAFQPDYHYFSDGYPGTHIAPTSTEFTLGQDGVVNGTGNKYLAYLWADDPSPTGMIRCGAVTGPTFVNLGWRAQFVMMKRADSAGPWHVMDDARGMAGATGKYLAVNSNAVEQTGSRVTVTATGFTPNIEAAPATYVYVAVREPITT